MRTKYAFTLSEVLLVLSVIGVVAALTIPTLIQKVSNDQFKTAWRKQFSAFSQATANIINSDAGGNFYSLITSTSGASFYPLYKKNMNTILECGSVLTGGNCFHATKDLTGATINATWFDDGAYILNDGTMVAFEDAGSSPNKYIWIDVNGIKGPNVLGKDVFGVKIYNDGIRPFGSTGDAWENTCTTTGYGCSAEFLYK